MLRLLLVAPLDKATPSTVLCSGRRGNALLGAVEGVTELGALISPLRTYRRGPSAVTQPEVVMSLGFTISSIGKGMFDRSMWSTPIAWRPRLQRGELANEMRTIDAAGSLVGIRQDDVSR